MRVPGSKTELSMFEYNSSAILSTDVGDENSWLATLAKPLILILFLGATCYISFNSVKKKRAEKKSMGSFGPPRGKGFGSSRGGGGFGGSKRRR